MNEYIVGLSYAYRLSLAASARHRGIKDWLESDSFH